MKTSVISFLLVTLSLHLSAAEPQFQALKEDYKAKAAVIERLNGIILTKVKIDKMSLAGALARLQKSGNTGDTQSAVINYVIRKPLVVGAIIDGKDPFGREPIPKKRPPKKLTLVSDSISFAKALDTLCQKAGYRWSIDFDEQKNPLLVIAL